MTVKELIEKLEVFEKDLPVLLDGYEGGLSEICEAKEISVDFNKNKEDYYGPHEESEDSKERVVHVSRFSNSFPEGL